MSDLLRFQPFHTNEEPIFYQGFGGAVRANYPNIPIEYTKVRGVRLENVDPISLGVIPKSSDTDIYIYLGFKVVSVTLSYSSVITTSYVNEDSSIIRIITDGTSSFSFYTNLFTKASKPNSFSSTDDKLEILMRKDNDYRFYYNGLTNIKNSYYSLTQEDPTELKLGGGESIVLNLYGLFIRQNGVVYHNWVPCKRNSDNKPGFYNAVNGEFITSAGMSVIPS